MPKNPTNEGTSVSAPEQRKAHAIEEKQQDVQRLRELRHHTMATNDLVNADELELQQLRFLLGMLLRRGRRLRELFEQPTAGAQTFPEDRAVLEELDELEEYARSRRKEVELATVIGMINRSSRDQQLSPVVLYLDDTAHYESVRQALEDALPAFGLQISQVRHPLHGSIWQAFIAVFKRQAAPERLEHAGDALTAGAKARWYGEPQSQITKAQGEAIANLLDTLQNTENALLAFSNILIVKIDGVPLVRELTPEQVEHLQRNPRLYTDPRLALNVLDVGLTNAGQIGASGTDQQAIAP
ncbi:hypothetical protein ACSDR0_38525 [Streptosporangium sp. G11]|uniref:hypothetical protein n=1 Tax=Streptosporangium sp. G11 TaxID=3436926 RepID=UPI003EB78C3B